MAMIDGYEEPTMKSNRFCSPKNNDNSEKADLVGVIITDGAIHKKCKNQKAEQIQPKSEFMKVSTI